MGRLVKVKLNDTEIWMETEETKAEPGPKRTSREVLAKEALGEGERLHSTIRAYCISLIKAFDSLEGVQRPQRITAEFGLKLSGDSKFYIVNAAGEASLKIIATWETE